MELLQRWTNSGIGGENKNVNYSIKHSKSFDYKTCITGFEIVEIVESRNRCAVKILK